MAADNVAVGPGPDKTKKSPSLAASDSSVPPPTRLSLAKSDSTTSAGRFSTKSVVSVPVTGNLPYGSLRVHEPPSPATPPCSADAASTGPSPSTPASRLLEQGDVFLILDLPQGFLVGCDTIALTTQTARPVLGFRGIPPGAHLVFVADPSGLSRCGYWFVTKEAARGEPRVKQWDRYNEVLGAPASRVEARSNINDLDSAYPNLVPYNHRQASGSATAGARNPPPPPKDPPRSLASPGADLTLDEAAIWRHLTSCITEALLGRVTGKTDPSASEWLVDTADSAKGDINFTQASKLFKTVVGSELTFLFPPQDSALGLHLLSLDENAARGAKDGESDRVAAAAATGTATLRASSPRRPDTTLVVENALNRSGISEADLTGEFQFVFLTAMHLGNPSCLDYWFHLVLKIVLRAHKLAVSRPALTRSLILTMHAQLVYGERHMSGGGCGGGEASKLGVPAAAGGGADDEGRAGILEMAPQYQNRLRQALIVYKRILNESLLGLGDAITKEQAAVGQAFSDLEAWFWKYGWDLRSDYAPETLVTEPNPAGPRPRLGLEADPADSDDDEYQPVLVELDENGREVGLVSWSY
ncbi:hypothetical protein MAPG_08121 [Magnaporthiopsis poae ATCC 64411]|uniref:AAR2 family protein n=1 Tax=Magnaporthiopsis poae (strain ATCC 64411 / 73-15) TaxID=644358 RepID=A0A0C4E6I3_MAGP6|nr:hypothetical protein MAPG_08121 [Magnaporthiopsis poae ATCC 64411]